MKELVIICNGKEIYKCKDIDSTLAYYTVETPTTIDYLKDLPSALSIAME